ncbi:hypothetical protein ABVB69_38830 [Streptomyces sp. NPDC000349]|uniref:hypothetical protein n=1 Tax=Streptomyces sp. NPDC000349 TaxID=3154249 RepID=UPI00336ABFD4
MINKLKDLPENSLRVLRPQLAGQRAARLHVLLRQALTSILHDDPPTEWVDRFAFGG